MLAIGRALVARPKLLLLDEPSLGLAPLVVRKIFQIIRDINAQGVTIFLVEQNAHMALGIAHRAYVLQTGQVIKSDSAKALLEDPDVKKASTEREAMAIVRKKLTQTFHEQLAKNFDLTKASTPHTIVHDSCQQWMVNCPDGVFDCIITDPPYAIDAHKMAPMSGSQAGTIHEYEDTYENAHPIWETIFSEGARVCKPQAHLYMFCDFRYFTELSELATRYGWDVWSTPIIWHKPGGGNLGDSTRGPRKSYETILFARRGDRKVTGVYLDVIVKNAADVVAATHAAAKPVDLYTDLLRRSCVPGDKVLDPCAGSCPILPAANRLRLIATAVEISHVHYAAGLQRLKEQ